MSHLLDLIRERMRRWMHGPRPVALALRVADTESMWRAVQWGGYGEHLRLLVDASRLVMQGGHAFADPGHPFRVALQHGPDALAAFYARLQPRDLCELHGVATTGDGDARVPPWEVPWIDRQSRSAPPGEAGLDASHGLSFFGPCSAEKVALEHRRLTQVSEAIRRDGYQPDRFGDITGYFLADGSGDFRFFVRGGKHRAAALVHAGTQQVPVAFKPDWPRLVRLEDLAHWPLVAQGQLSSPAAAEVFLSYFRPPGQQQTRGP